MGKGMRRPEEARISVYEGMDLYSGQYRYSAVLYTPELHDSGKTNGKKLKYFLFDGYDLQSKKRAKIAAENFARRSRSARGIPAPKGGE